MLYCQSAAIAVSQDMASGAGVMTVVSTVRIIHAEKKVDDSIRSISIGIEEVLGLAEKVQYKRHFKEKDNVAAEILKLVEQQEREGPESKAVVIFSSRLCQVMKNNKDVSHAFQRIILRDLRDTPGERCLAFLWAKDFLILDPAFTNAFSPEFVEFFKLRRPGVKCRKIAKEMELNSFVEAIRKQWIGVDPPAVSMSVETAPCEEPLADIETVRIIHGGDRAAKQAVREISRELEDGFELEDPTKYKLYPKAQENDIPKIIMSEVAHMIETDGPNSLGIVVWCPRLLELMTKTPFQGHFENQLVTAAQSKVVHMCIRVAQYEVVRLFPKMRPMHFIPLETYEDGTIDVAGLTARVSMPFGQVKRNATGVDKPARQNDPINHHGERISSEVSEPSALASEEGPPPIIRPAPLNGPRPGPLEGVGPSLGLVGNPSNQNQQSGRVVPSACDSHSTDEAGYNSTGRMAQGPPLVAAQPSDDSGRGDNQNWKFVPNNGRSWNGPPSEYHLDPNQNPLMGIEMPPLNGLHQSVPPGSSNDVWQFREDAVPDRGHQQPASGAASGVHTQATPSESSSDRSKFLADGEHSMPLTSLHSQAFGSREPVLPTRDATVESISVASGSRLKCQPSSSLQAMASSGSHPPPSGPATNRWAPSDCLSTEMRCSDVPRPNEKADMAASGTSQPLSSFQRGSPSSSSQIKQPHSSEEDSVQRPTANKFPRLVSQGYPGSMTSSTPSYRQAGGSESSQPSLPPSHPPSFQPSLQPGSNAASNPSQHLASLPHSSQSSNSCNISDPASRTSTQLPSLPFVQCSADGGQNGPTSMPNYANNLSSRDAFQVEDDRDIGPGQRLPNRAVAAEFMSLPPAGQRLRSNGNNGIRAESTPPRINPVPAQDFDSDSEMHDEVRYLDPPDHPIKDMDYRCREILKMLLDPETNTGSDWKLLAYSFGMKFERVRYLDNLKSSSTLALLGWLAEYKPDVTCGQFKEAAKKHHRLDVVRKMTKFGY